MHRISKPRLSPTGVLAAAAVILAGAALAVSLGGRATATSAELGKVGKVKERQRSATVPDGQFNVARARCKGRTRAVSGGFGIPPDADAFVWSSARAGNKGWDIGVQNPPGGGAVGFTAIVDAA